MRLPPAAPILALAMCSLGLAPHADAAPKKGAGKPTPPACGVKVLPLVLGNSWTYENVAAPVAGDPQIARIAPTPPTAFTITVTKVEPKGTDTLITLEEKYQYPAKDTKDPKKTLEKTVTSTITCNPKTKFEISPESFFFAGEPGGWYGIKFDTFTRKKETTWKLTKGTIGDVDWIEELEAHFVREATPGTEVKSSGGKATLERRFQPQVPETIITKLGTYKAEKLLLTTTGRVKLDQPIAPEGKSCRVAKEDGTYQPVDVCEMPGGWTNQLWMVDNVGVVQALNKYSHNYQLTAQTLK